MVSCGQELQVSRSFTSYGSLSVVSSTMRLFRVRDTCKGNCACSDTSRNRFKLGDQRDPDVHAVRFRVLGLGFRARKVYRV